MKWTGLIVWVFKICITKKWSDWSLKRVKEPVFITNESIFRNTTSTNPANFYMKKMLLFSSTYFPPLVFPSKKCSSFAWIQGILTSVLFWHQANPNSVWLLTEARNYVVKMKSPSLFKSVARMRQMYQHQDLALLDC